MPTPLTVSGSTYQYPDNNDNAPWGEDATAWAVAVTGVLDQVVGTGDIPQTVATIANNMSSPTNIIGLAFSPITTRGAIIYYSLYRFSTGSGATEAVETGQMFVSYMTNSNTWDLAISAGNQGQAGVIFSISPNGQVQYTSTNFAGTTPTGIITFKAAALLNQ
jgi:hypothetical protein